MTNHRPGQKQKSITNGRSTFTCERDGSALLESRRYKVPFLAATSARSLDRTADSISPSLAPFLIIIFLNIDDDDQVTKLAFKLPLSLWVRTLLLYSPTNLAPIRLLYWLPSLCQVNFVLVTKSPWDLSLPSIRLSRRKARERDTY